MMPIRVSSLSPYKMLPIDKVFLAHFQFWFISIFQLVIIYTIFILIRRQYRSVFKQKAIKNRIEIWGEFLEVKKDTSLKIDNENPYIILVKANMMGEVQEFVSDYLWEKPHESQIPKNIMVYVNEFNPKSYYVDLSFMKNIASL